MSTTRWLKSVLQGVVTLTFAVLLMLLPLHQPAWAGPVDWHEVPASDDGRQWWDAGSLRVNRDGNLTVLSRFQPAPPADQPRNADGSEPRPPASDLYVMEIDCGQNLFRDTSINGLPQWGSSWQAAAGDDLISSTITEACAAGGTLLAGF